MELYEYQKVVARSLRNGKNVILQAPTGSGKTIAALWPFFESWDRGRASDFPTKCLYAVPMRVLANQFVDECRRIVTQEMVLPEIPRVAIQTGERPNDRDLAADVTFATIDQVLSSFLHMPYSLPRKLANQNAGAVLASYLVFDEFHLFDPISTLPTTLEMLRMVRGVAPFLLMTATFSTGMLSGLANELDAAIVPADDEQRTAMLNLPVERSKTRYYHWSDKSLSADGIIERHMHRSLVVCNTVGRAQAVYRELQDHPALGDTEVILLHSRFLPEDRATKEQRVRNLLGKNVDRTKGSAIVVATQVVEVGLDISAEVLHTESAPANAVLQRAGRCARFQDEVGNVYVYPVESALPYQGQEIIIQLTEEWLRNHDGRRLNFIDEQALVDFAHRAFDEQVLQGIAGTTWKHRQRVQAALNGNTEAAGELVRKVSSQQVTISAEPDKLLARPFSAPMFSLHPGTLQGAVKTWLEETPGDIEGDVIWRLEEAQDNGQESDAVRYFWRPVRDKSLLRGAALIAVHPALADYDADTGLMLDHGGSFRAEDHVSGVAKANKGNDWVSFYRLESYQEHIRLVYAAFERITWPELERAAAKLEQRAGWPAGALRQAAELAVLLHDVGKLAKAWQQWVVDWQKQVGKPIRSDFWAAHTDFEGRNARHIELQRKMRRRPPHAVEGAVAASPLLVAFLREQPSLLRAAFSAIARHHGAFSSNFQPYQLPAAAPGAVRATLLLSDRASSLDPSKLRMSDDPARTPISSILVDAAQTDDLLAYMLLARALRRADQLGTAEGAKIS